MNRASESGVAIAGKPETKRNFEPHLHSNLRSLTNKSTKLGSEPMVALLSEKGRGPPSRQRHLGVRERSDRLFRVVVSASLAPGSWQGGVHATLEIFPLAWRVKVFSNKAVGRLRRCLLSLSPRNPTPSYSQRAKVSSGRIFQRQSFGVVMETADEMNSRP